jgi:hypothetical protein
VASVTANVSNLTTGAANVALSTSGGPWTIGSTTYSYRSAVLTANATISEGAKSFTVNATDNLGTISSNSGNGSVTIDNTAPGVTNPAVGPSSGVSVGFLKQAGGYYVYANASDGSGSGVASVTANVSNLTTGAANVALSTSGGPWTIGSTTYSYRSAVLTANATISEGAKSFTVNATDNLGTISSNSGNGSVTIDNTAPTLVSVSAANDGTAGQIDHKNVSHWDTLTFTYSDVNGVAPRSVVSGWDGTGTQNVNVTFTDGGTSNDTITVPGIGTVNLGSTTWLTGTSTISETLSMSSTNVFVLAITADPPGNAPGNAASNFTWSASGGTAADSAGNVTTGSITSNNQRF